MRTRDEHDEYEAALRRLPEAHSLALRLRDSGAPDDVICEYLGIEPEGLGALLELANQKLLRAGEGMTGVLPRRYHFRHGRPLAADGS